MIQFEFEGERYSFRFHYAKKEKARELRLRAAFKDLSYGEAFGIIGGGPGESVMVTLAQIWHQTQCVLLHRTGEKWVPVYTNTAQCSPKDQFCRAIGREIALGKYKHTHAEMYPAMREAWKNRTQTPARAPQN